MSSTPQGDGAGAQDDIIRISWTVDERFERRRVAWRTRQFLLAAVPHLVFAVTIGAAIAWLGIALVPDMRSVLLLALALGVLLEPGVGLIAMRRRERRWARLRSPAGATLASAFFADHLRLEGPAEDRFVPYRTLGGVGEHDGFVTIRWRGGGSFTVPVELCPPTAQARIEGSLTAPRPVRLERAYFTEHTVTDERYARSAVRWAAMRGVARPGWYVPQLLLLVLAGALVPSGLWFVAACLVALRMAPLLGTLGRWRALVGVEMSSRVDDDGLSWSEGPDAIKWDYACFDRVSVHGAVVELRTTDDRAWGQYPRGNFPDDSLDLLVRRVRRGPARLS